MFINKYLPIFAISIFKLTVMGTKQILKVLYIFSWIIFVGLGIEAGAFLTNAFFTLVNPAVVNRLWQEVDLSDLFKYAQEHFFVITLIIGIVTVTKALMFYLIIKILHEKKLDLSQPFSQEVRRFIFSMSYAALLIGLFSLWGARYSEWLVKQGVKMPGLEQMHLGGADVWLFMCVIFFVIAQIFKKGIEIQKENELTI